MSLDQFEERVEALKRRGMSDYDAGRIAGLLGDVIETDETGKWIVRNEAGAEFTRIDPLE